MDNSQVQLVETNNYSIDELENLDINYDFLNVTQPTSLISKVIKTSNGADIKYKVVEDYTMNKLSTDKVLLPKNTSYQVNEITENKLYNVPLFLILIIGLFFASWKERVRYWARKKFSGPPKNERIFYFLVEVKSGCEIVPSSLISKPYSSSSALALIPITVLIANQTAKLTISVNAAYEITPKKLNTERCVRICPRYNKCTPNSSK